MQTGRPPKYYEREVQIAKDMPRGSIYYFTTKHSGGLVKRLYEALDKKMYDIRVMKKGVRVKLDPVWNFKKIVVEE